MYIYEKGRVNTRKPRFYIIARVVLMSLNYIVTVPITVYRKCMHFSSNTFCNLMKEYSEYVPNERERQRERETEGKRDREKKSKRKKRRERKKDGVIFNKGGQDPLKSGIIRVLGTSWTDTEKETIISL